MYFLIRFLNLDSYYLRGYCIVSYDVGGGCWLGLGFVVEGENLLGILEDNNVSVCNNRNIEVY